MLDYRIVYLISRQQTAALARSALPDAPTLPAEDVPVGVRVRFAATLRRWADALAPADGLGISSSPLPRAGG